MIMMGKSLTDRSIAGQAPHGHQPDVGNVAWIGIIAVIDVATYAVAVAVSNIWPVMVRPNTSLQTQETYRALQDSCMHSTSAKKWSAHGLSSGANHPHAVQAITGATAAVASGWVFPACIMLRTASGRAAWLIKLGACFIILLGLITAVVAVESTIEPYFRCP